MFEAQTHRHRRRQRWPVLPEPSALLNFALTRCCRGNNISVTPRCSGGDRDADRATRASARATQAPGAFALARTSPPAYRSFGDSGRLTRRVAGSLQQRLPFRRALVGHLSVRFLAVVESAGGPGADRARRAPI